MANKSWTSHIRRFPKIPACDPNDTQTPFFRQVGRTLAGGRETWSETVWQVVGYVWRAVVICFVVWAFVVFMSAFGPIEGR